MAGKMKDKTLTLLSINPSEKDEIVSEDWTPSFLPQSAGVITWRDCIPGYYKSIWDQLPRDAKLAMFVLAEVLANDGIVWDPTRGGYRSRD